MGKFHLKTEDRPALFGAIDDDKLASGEGKMLLIPAIVKSVCEKIGLLPD